MSLNEIVLAINNVVWGWPTILFVVGVALYTTFMLRGVQFRYFIESWTWTFTPEKDSSTSGDMTPFQSFLNALSTSVGNGSIAGIATAIAAGGPGAGFWVFVMGFLSMAIRFSEVYLSCEYVTSTPLGSALGGPMIYLSKVPGGKYLPSIFAFFCLMLSWTSGNAMQANSIRVGLVRTLDIAPLTVALILFVFIVYVIAGGAQRIIKVSDMIVPVKVGVFFLTAIAILFFHAGNIIPALKLIVMSALSPQAVLGGALGFSIQEAMRFGLVRTLNAAESGLGTAAILFGGSGSKKPVKNGVMAMLSAFMSANLVCFSIALLLVASGVWDNGQTGADLTISAYETVFGNLGGWIVTFLSISFGMGVLVAYAYISRACWNFLTDGRWMNIHNILFCGVTFLGAMATVEVVWNAIDLVNAGLVVSNLIGIMYLLPEIVKGLKNHEARA